jgi:hypothetical protein
MTGYKEETFPQESFLNSALPSGTAEKSKIFSVCRNAWFYGNPSRLTVMMLSGRLAILKGSAVNSKPLTGFL